MSDPLPTDPPKTESSRPRRGAPFITAPMVAVCLMVPVAILVQRAAGPVPLAFSPEGLPNVAHTWAPLFAIAAFIERAVEVVISAWRDEGALTVEEKKNPDEERRYKLETQRYSFIVSLILSLGASLVGVRALSTLLATLPANLPQWQQDGFAIFDVAITSLLLAGGADGIHQVVATITTFLDTTKQNAKEKAP